MRGGGDGDDCDIPDPEGPDPVLDGKDGPAFRVQVRCDGCGDAGQEPVRVELRQHVGKDIGPIAKPKRVLVVPELPKTRSGKIMRRLLKDVAEGRDPGDSTTLADPTVMQRIVETLAPKA